MNRNSSFFWLSVIAFLTFLLFQFGPAWFGEYEPGKPHLIERTEAAPIAERFLAERYGLDGPFDAFAMYQAEREAYGYLDREALLPAFRTWEASLPLDYYTVELMEPNGVSRHYVDVNPYTGEVVEWSVELGEGEGGGAAAAEPEAAESAASALEELGFTEVRLLHYDKEAGHARFAVDGLALGEARAEAAVRMDGGTVGAVRLDWIVPDAYVAEVAQQDAYGAWLGSIGFMLSAALQFAAVIYVLLKAGDARFRRGLFLAFAFAALYIWTNFNMLPAVKSAVLGLGAWEAASASDEGSVLVGVIINLILANAVIMLLGVGTYFSLVAGDTMFRRSGARKPWLEWKDRDYGAHVVQAARKGYGFAFIILGLQAVLFWGAERFFDSWYTIDASNSSYSMLFPLLMPVLAWCAAISEEAVYRMFGIPAFRKLFRFTAPAVLLTGIVWALGHVQYPIYPFYTRLVEVTVIGILFGYIFLRHGFITAVYAHAIVDSIWFSLAVLAPPAAGVDLLAGLGYVLFPLALAHIIALLHRNRKRRGMVEPAS